MYHRLSSNNIDYVQQTVHYGTGTFRAQDLSFPRTNSPYGELSFLRLFVPRNFHSLRMKVPWNFRSRAFSFSGTFVLGEQRFLGTFAPWTFRSEELSFPGLLVTFSSQEVSFLRLFYKALAMNADSYSNCHNLFCSRPSSVCFPKIN